MSYFTHCYTKKGLRIRVGAAICATMLKTAVSLNTIDLYICRSLTACEANKISNNFVLLPQWIFPEELELSKTVGVKSSRIRIVTYTSYADSPRLLNTSHFVALARAVERTVKRDFELIIINPKGHTSSLGPVKIVRPMPRQEFLSFLASADLYIEGNTDEELKQAALEAMAMGIPVAKVTYQRYWNRQDYKENLILARSFRELVEKIVEYVNNIEDYYHYYSKRGREFVLTKRTWDAVKGPFLTALKLIGQQRYE